MSAETDFLNSTVRDHIISDGESIDNIFEGTPTLDWFWKSRETQDGGINAEWVFFETDPQQGQTITAFQDYLVAPVQNDLKASIIFADYFFPITISRLHMKKIRGPEANINYVQNETTKAESSARTMLSTDLFGDGLVRNHPKFMGVQITPLIGLKAIIAEDRVYAGHDSTTLEQLDSYVKTIAPTTFDDMYQSSHLAFILDAMEEVITETDFDDGRMTDFITTSKNGFGALKRAGYRGAQGVAAAESGGLLQEGGSPRNATARAGIKRFLYEEIDVMRDGQCDADRMYLLESSSIFLQTIEGLDMTFEPFQDNSTGDARVGGFHLSAAIVCTEPRRQGVITGIATRDQGL